MATYSVEVYDLSTILSNLTPVYMIKPYGVEQFSFYVELAQVYHAYIGKGTPITTNQVANEMYEGKKNTDKWYPVRIMDSVDMAFPRTGVAVGSVTVTYGFESAVAETAYAIVAGDWKEQGNGNYWLNIGASEFTQNGKYTVKVRTYPISNDIIFYVEVKNFMTAESVADVPIIRDGIAQAGAAGSIRLDLGASALNDFYKGDILVLTNGSGVGQSRKITDYNGATQLASIQPDWVIVPNNTSEFVIIPEGDAILTQNAVDSVLDADQSLHLGAAIDNRTLGGMLSQSLNAKYEDRTLVKAAFAVPAQGITDPMVASGIIQYEIVKISLTRNFVAPDFTYYNLWRYDANQDVIEVKASLGIVW